MKKIKFNLGHKKHFKLFSDHMDMEKLSFMCEVKISWHNDFECFIIGRTYSCFFREALESVLTLVLNKGLMFDSSLLISPVILFSKHFVLEGLKDRPWVTKEDGVKYNLFSVNNKEYSMGTYLYNNKDNEIIFEVGRKFCWLDKDELSEEELLQEEQRFLQFIDSYDPIIKEVVTRDVVERWLVKVEKLNEIILYNESKNFGCDLNFKYKRPPSDFFDE